METLEDKIIRNKINSIDNLPEGYAPNLDSKWSMLEAGLEGRPHGGNGRKQLIAAAMVLLLGGAMVWMHQLTQRRTLPTIVQSNPGIQQPVVVAHPKPQLPAVRRAAPRHPEPARIHPTPVLAQHVEVPAYPVAAASVAPVDVVPPANQQTLAAAPRIPKHQFIEMDFNEVPTAQPQPNESTIAFRPFTFGIGQYNHTSITTEGSNETAFRFQKSF